MDDGRALRRITAVDVARAAGVSQSAVSRTFTPGASASARTRERVLKAAEDLGYRPNFIARSLRAQRTNLVGVLIADFGNPWPQLALKELIAALRRHGLRPLLFDVDGADSLAGLVPQVLQYQVDGLIVGATDVPPSIVETCRATGTPIVAFGRHGQKRRGISSAAADDARAGAEVADLLKARGYRRFAYVSGDGSGKLTWNSRGKGFAQRATQLGLAPVLRFAAGETSYEAGIRAARALLAPSPRPDAVFCQNDVLAMGFLDAARDEFGLDVPGDLAVVGFDDIPAASQRPYRLTTVRQPVADMMTATVELLVHHLAEGGGETEARLMPSQLIERGTVRTAAHDRIPTG